jgi:hypothetical protein
MALISNIKPVRIYGSFERAQIFKFDSRLNGTGVYILDGNYPLPPEIRGGVKKAK